MTAQEPNPERRPAPWDTTVVPEPAATAEEPPSSATRPMPVEPNRPNFAPWQPPPKRSTPLCCWVAVVSSLTSVVLAVLLWVRTPSAPAAAPVPTAGEGAKPPATQPAAGTPQAFQAALQPYLDAAEKGDVHAMRMLGAMYYHGLDLPRNRAEGLKWYRKAAATGSKAAQEELRQLE